MIRRLAVLLMPLALAAGCGGDDSREVRYLNSPPLVSQEQVERYPEGSPGRTVFEWMRAVAFSDATTAARLQHPPKPMTPLQLARLRELPLVQLIVDRVKKPRIDTVEQSGRRATVVGGVTSVDRKIGKVTYDFKLERIRGDWKIKNPPFSPALTRARS